MHSASVDSQSDFNKRMVREWIQVLSSKSVHSRRGFKVIDFSGGSDNGFKLWFRRVGFK